MQEYEWIAPCHFGTESVCKKEVIDLGYKISEVSDGKVSFYGDLSALARANVFMRTTERILLKVASFKAVTFDELFENTKSIPWEEYIPKNARFWVAKANSVKSKLFSPSDIQSIIKKAIVERLKLKYHMSWFPEDGEDYPLRVTIMKDMVTIGMDTTGTSLHKRGYRKWTVKAPITETLAASLIGITPWRADRHLIDPFCGSGTIPIEAAMIGANIAPGMNREFISDRWTAFDVKKIFYNAYDEARSLVKEDASMSIQAFDISDECIKMAKANAELAGVDKYIHFQRRPVSELSSPRKYGFIITNPPYGERIEDKKDMPALYSEIGKAFDGLDSWSYYIITAYEQAEQYIGRKADKNRKLYNGMMKTYYLQYMGPKPPRRTDRAERDK